MSLAMWLRAGRAGRKLSVDDVAKITKIQPRILEKLESGQLDGLPAEVFVKGFVRSFAKCVGLSEQEALERLGAAQSAQASQLPGAATVVAKALVETMSPTVRLVEPTQLPSPAPGGVDAEPMVDVAAAEVSPVAAEPIAPSPAIDAAPIAELPVVSPAAAPKRRRNRTSVQPVVPAGPVANLEEIAADVVSAGSTADDLPSVTKKRRTRKKSPTETAVTVDAPTADATIAAKTVKAPRTRRAKKTTQAPIVAIAEALAEAAADAVESSVEPNVETNESLPVTTPFVRTDAGDVFAEPPSSLAAGSASDLPAAEVATATDATDLAELKDATSTSNTSDCELVMSVDPAVSDAQLAEGSQRISSSSIELEVGGTWQPTMPPMNTTPTAPWRRPQLSTEPAYVVPTLVIDDADPDSADREREQREKASRDHSRLSFLPPILLDREDRSARQGGLTLAVIILLIAATLTLSYLMRRPSPSGDGVTMVDGHAQLFS